MSNQYWIYILECTNGNYYTGYTTDLTRRYAEHCSGKSHCKYTRSFKPIKIAASWTIIGDKSHAMKIERFIKKLSRKEKEKLVIYPKRLSELFDCKQLKPFS